MGADVLATWGSWLWTGIIWSPPMVRVIIQPALLSCCLNVISCHLVISSPTDFQKMRSLLLLPLPMKLGWHKEWPCLSVLPSVTHLGTKHSLDWAQIIILARWCILYGINLRSHSTETECLQFPGLWNGWVVSTHFLANCSLHWL